MRNWTKHLKLSRKKQAKPQHFKLSRKKQAKPQHLNLSRKKQAKPQKYILFHKKTSLAAIPQTQLQKLKICHYNFNKKTLENSLFIRDGKEMVKG